MQSTLLALQILQYLQGLAKGSRSFREFRKCQCWNSVALVTTFSYNMLQLTSELFYKQYLELEHYVLCTQGGVKLISAQKTSPFVLPPFLLAYFVCFCVLFFKKPCNFDNSPFPPFPNALFALPQHKSMRTSFSLFIQWTHIYQVPVMYKALCGVGAVALLR